MSTITHSTDFFHFFAPHHSSSAAIDDRLERAILECQRKDAEIVRHMLAWIVKVLAIPEDRANDPMEQAILARRRHDAATIRNAFRR